MDKMDEIPEAPLLPGQFSVNEALTMSIESLAEAYGGEPKGIDLNARAWVLTNEAVNYFPFERGVSTTLKEAVKRAMRSPSTVRWIECEKRGGGTEVLYWKTISEIWEQKELWKE